MTTQTQTRRGPRGQILDEITRRSLAEYVERATWRRAIRYLLVGEGVIRRALAGEPIRSASAVCIRTALAELEQAR